MVGQGSAHTVALKSDGTLWAWGHNADGRLGIGSFDDKLIPTRIGIDDDLSLIHI